MPQFQKITIFGVLKAIKNMSNFKIQNYTIYSLKKNIKKQIIVDTLEHQKLRLLTIQEQKYSSYDGVIKCDKNHRRNFDYQLFILRLWNLSSLKCLD